MKKYTILIAVTLGVIALVIGVGAMTKETPVTVKTVTLKPQTVRQTVECTGRVELADGHEVFVEIPCVAGRVYVSAGQTVNKGDALFDVDMDATRAVLAQMGGTIPDGMDVQSYTVTAPASGVVSTLSVQSGGAVDSTTPCAVIAPSKALRIAAVVREKHLRLVEVGQTALVSGVGFDKEQYRGSVASLADSAHQQYIGTVNETVVDAVILLEDGEADDSLRVGLGATVSVVVDTVEDAVLVPYTCIAQDEEGREYVYVCTDDGTARRQTLTVGQEYADGALVVSGASANDRLVLHPDGLQGDTVLIREEG